MAIYSLLLPSMLSSYQSASSNFSTVASKVIVDQTAWKIGEVNLMDEGAVLEMHFNSPLDFEFNIENGEIQTLNYSAKANGGVDATMVVKKGRNDLQFTKTSNGVEVELIDVSK